MKQKLVAFLMTVSMCAALVGCGGSSGNSDSVGEDTASEAAGETSGETEDSSSSESGTHDSLTVAFSGDITDLSPNAAFADSMRHIAFNIYEHLWSIDDDGEMTYRAATSHEYVDDTHLKLTLRDDIYDTLGNQFTASDVLFSIEHCKGTPFGSDLVYIDTENSEIADDFTVILTLTQPYASQVSALTTIDMFDEDSYNASPDGFASDPVGYGPYQLEELTVGTQAVITARDDYWDGEPQLKTITFKIVPENSQKINLLLSGDVDVIDEVPVSDIETINNTEGLKIDPKDTIASEGLFFNLGENSPCNDIHLRKAIAYATDAASLIDVVYEGNANQATSGYSKALSDHNEYWDEVYAGVDNYYDYDLEKAKAELAQSAYPDGVALRAIQTGTNHGDMNAQLMQAMLSEIGITMEITQTDVATANSTVKDNPDDWDLYFSGWLANSSSVTAIASIQICSNNFCNWSGSEFEEFTALVKDAESTVDEAKFLEKDNAVLKMTDEMLPMMGIADRVIMQGTKEGIHLDYYFVYLWDLFHTTWE